MSWHRISFVFANFLHVLCFDEVCSVIRTTTIITKSCLLICIFQFDRTHKDAFMSETEAGPADFVRRVDAGVLNFKHVLMAVLIVLISAALYFFT